MRYVKVAFMAVGVLIIGAVVALAVTHRSAPEVVETVMRGKVSSNAPLTITFNHIMRPGSVRQAVSFAPEVKGRVEWGLKTFTFIPEDGFQQGETYVLTISQQAKNILGKALAQPFVSEFIVVEPPKVLLTVPQGPTGIDGKVTVMFDRPMTALTTLDEGAPAMPITITPSVNGRYKWVGTSAVQFIPTERFQYATHYAITIPKGIESLDKGVTTEDQTFEFETPRLIIEQVGMPNYPEDILWLQFNQEVDLASVKQHVNIYRAGENKPALPLSFAYGTSVEYEEQNGKQVEKIVDNKKVVDVHLKDGDFGYSRDYWLEITHGIMGKEGNIPSDSTRGQQFATNGFVVYASPQCSGACADPKPVVTFQFHEEVKLESVTAALTLEPAFAYTPAYGKQCDPEWEPDPDAENEECPLVDDKRVVEFPAREVFGNERTYHVALRLNDIQKMDGKSPNTTLALEEWDVTTAASPRIQSVWGGRPGEQSYKRFCIYSNNQLDVDSVKEQIRFSPDYTKKNRDGKPDIYLSTLEPWQDRTWSDRYCDGNGPREAWVTNVQVLLNSSTVYAITMPGTVTDVFSQRIGQDFIVSNYVTEPIKDEDRSLILRQQETFAVATKNMNIPLVFETKNLDEATLEICRMTPEEYVSVQTEGNRNTKLDYTKTGWEAFVPSSARCAWYTQKTVRIKNKPWEQVFTEVDVVKEAGSDFVNGLYYVQMSSPHVYTTSNPQHYSEEERRWVSDGPQKKIIRPFSIISFTDTHMALKQANDKLLVWATGLSSGAPKSDVTLNFYDDRGALVVSGLATGEDGIATRAVDNPDVAYVVGKTAADAAILRTSWQDGIGSWEFGISESGFEKGVQGYVYTDRPIYRPGHTLYFKGIVRDELDAHYSLSQARLAEVVITDAGGVEVYRKQLALSTNGTFDDSFIIDSLAPLGFWRIYLDGVCESENACEGAHASAYFSVEEYKKPEYKSDIVFTKEGYINRETLSADITGAYFFGAPLRNGNLTWSITAQNYYFDGYTDEWFNFSDSDYDYGCYGECPYEDNTVARGERQLDELGKATITHEITLHKNGKGEEITPRTAKLYTLNATVVDENNRSVYNSKTAVVHPGELYVGVRNESYVVKEGERAGFTAISVDTKGTPQRGKTLNAELIRQEWKSIKKKNVDGMFYWENEMKEELVDTQRLTTGDDGKVAFQFMVPSGGSYRVRMKARDARGNDVASSIGFWVSSNSYINWRRENNNRMELELDKPEYRVGETAKLLVRSPYQNVKALFALERGSIMEYKVLDITSNAQVIEVPVTEDMIPNVFASVMVVQKEIADEPPDFKLGYETIAVNTQKKRLFITLTTDKEQYKPRETVRLKLVTENEAREKVPANISVAVVDESVLALKGNPKKDLLAAFYDRYGLGVSNASSLTKLLERADLSDKEGSKGGGGGGEQEFQYRGDFKATAHWEANVTTDQNGQAELSFTLPDNLTTWIIEVVGATDTTLVGVEEKSFITTRDVIVRPVLPRFIRGGDALDIAAIVHNFTGDQQTFDVSLATEFLKRISRERDSVPIDNKESRKIMWNVESAVKDIGKKAVIRLKALAGNYSDGVETTLPILSYASPESVATMNMTDAQSFKERVVVPDSVDAEQGSLEITAGATLATFLPASFEYLVRFPYASNEQTVSALIPMMALKRAVELPHLKGIFSFPELYDDFGGPISLDETVEVSLQRLYNSQRTDGGWGYWADSPSSYAYVTAYILHGLHAVKEAGYAVDERVMSRGVEFLRNFMVRNYDLCNPSAYGNCDPQKNKTTAWADSRAYFLFVMDELGQPDVALALNLWDDEKLLSTFGRVILAMVFDSDIKSIAASNASTRKLQSALDSLVKHIEGRARIDARGTYIKPDGYDGRFWTTNTKITAHTLQALTRINPEHPLIPRIINWLIKSRHDGHWDTTNDTASALVALTEYLVETKETEAVYTGTVLLNGKLSQSFEITQANITQSHGFTYPISSLVQGAEGNTFEFEKEGTGKLYYEMLLNYYLPVEKLDPRSEGFAVEREYYRTDDKLLEHPVRDAKVGETLVGKLTIAIPEQRDFVAVESPLPAGFELVNFNLATSDQTLQQYEGSNFERENNDGYYPSCWCGGGYWEHKELRDDRLFLFGNKMMPGVYEYTYVVQVTTPGVFAHPPARAFEMYFPENFGRTRGEKFIIKE